MACHPSGGVVDIVGINASDHGRLCENHKCCGSLLAPDVVVRFRCVQLERKNDPDGAIEAPALAVYHVTGGVDGCLVGFLRRRLLRYKNEYDGKLAQVTEVFTEKSSSPSEKG